MTRCLTALCSQSEAPRLEIVVVDDGETGLPEQVAGRVQQTVTSAAELSLRVVSSGRVQGQPGGVNRARNRGLEVATGDPIAFLDDDIEVTADWAARLVQTVDAYPEAGCLGGPYVLHAEAIPRFRCGRDHLDHLSFCPEGGMMPRPVEEVWGANFAVRRWAIDKIGPFDVALSGAGDEIEWQVRLRRAGGQILYDPGLRARHWRHGDELGLKRLMRAKYTRERTRPRFWLHLSSRSLGLPVRALRSHALAIRCLLHAIRYRCRGGLIDASGYFGLGIGCLSAMIRPR